MQQARELRRVLVCCGIGSVCRDLASWQGVLEAVVGAVSETLPADMQAPAFRLTSE